MLLRASQVPGSGASVVLVCEDSAICIGESGAYYCDQEALTPPSEPVRFPPDNSVIRKIEDYKIHCENGFVLEIVKELHHLDDETLCVAVLETALYAQTHQLVPQSNTEQ